MLQGQLIQSRRYIMFFQGLWKSSAWHWSRSKETSSGWFKGWMDLKGIPNGFKPGKADEKLPFSKQQTVFELATAFAQRYLWRGRCPGMRWFQVTIQIWKKVEEKMGVGTKSKAILQHLLQVLCKSLPECQVSISFTLNELENVGLRKKTKTNKQSKTKQKQGIGSFRSISHHRVLWWNI